MGLERGLDPILIAAGLTETRPVVDRAGKPVLDGASEPKTILGGKYGMHALPCRLSAAIIQSKSSA